MSIKDVPFSVLAGQALRLRLRNRSNKPLPSWGAGLYVIFCLITFFGGAARIMNWLFPPMEQWDVWAYACVFTLAGYLRLACELYVIKVILWLSHEEF